MTSNFVKIKLWHRCFHFGLWTNKCRLDIILPCWCHFQYYSAITKLLSRKLPKICKCSSSRIVLDRTIILLWRKFQRRAPIFKLYPEYVPHLKIRRRAYSPSNLSQKTLLVLNLLPSPSRVFKYTLYRVTNTHH